MAVVVGLNFPALHDGAAAAIVDGKLVFAVEEERFTRHRYAVGEVPLNSVIRAIQHLGTLGMAQDDVDAFALNWDLRAFRLGERVDIFLDSARPILGRGYAKSYSSLAKVVTLSAFKGLTQASLARLFLEGAYRKMGWQFPRDCKIIPVLHHLSHAASAYYFSGFDSCAVLTIDGRGETDSTVVWDVKNGEFERVADVSLWEGSIGEVYEYLSGKMGFDALSGPGKVMELAPYGGRNGELARRFAALARVFDGGDAPYAFNQEFRRRNYKEMYERIASYLVQGLNLDWDPRAEMCKDAADLARHTQEFAEELVLGVGRWAKAATGATQLAIAGGVALNAKANMRLHYSHIYDELWVFPAANDAGSAIGAAAYVHHNVLGEKMRHGRLEDVYTGPGASDEAVGQMVKRSKWSARFIGDDVTPVSDLILKGMVLGWFQGRSEFGPRALGNRSIVANPTDKRFWRAVNEIKGREFWRPLAPSVLERSREACFEDSCDHKFMVLMFQMSKEGGSQMPAACHVDGTARPQIVVQKDNKRWYDLIDSFGEVSGVHAVLNTSFNLGGEPLVQTPDEALRSFAVSGLDALFLQGWLITKK